MGEFMRHDAGDLLAIEHLQKTGGGGDGCVIRAATRGECVGRSFIDQVRQHPICVTTAGPHRSNGFKFAEYVAMSRCIVAEPVVTEIPGNFAEPRNYLTFTSPEACVQRVLQLSGDRGLRAAQMQANRNYFEDWMEPERLARRLVDAVARREPWAEGFSDDEPLVAGLRH